MGGFLGSILLGALADPSECSPGAGSEAPDWCVYPNSVNRSWEQLGKQVAGTCFCAAYSFVVTIVMLKAINLVVPILPPKEHRGKLDEAMHGEQAYSPSKAYAKDSPSLPLADAAQAANVRAEV